MRRIELTLDTLKDIIARHGTRGATAVNDDLYYPLSL